MSHLVKRGIDVAEAMATWPIRTTRQVLKDSKVYEETTMGTSIGEGLSLAEEMAGLPFQVAREMLVGNTESGGGSPSPAGQRLSKIEERLDSLENRILGSKRES